MKFNRLLYAVCAVLSQSAYATYNVSIEGSPSSLRFSLDLPAVHDRMRLTQEQTGTIFHPHCGATGLAANGSGKFIIAPECGHVQWEVEVPSAPKAGFNAAEQKNWRMKDWALLTSPNVLLRVEGETAGSSLKIRQTGLPDRLAYVPAPNEAPEFYVVGKAAEIVRQVGGVTVRYVADDLANVTQRGLIAHHAEALARLQKIFPPARLDTPFAGQLLVVMLGNTDAKQASGAGGSRSLLVDYPRLTNERDTLLLAVMAHEQVHQLMALAGLETGSIWLSEGLAHYYGLKIMRQVLDKQEKADEVWGLFVKPELPVAEGLAVLEQRFRAGDKSLYRFFYSQGATFFALLDQALQQASGGRTSLDDFVAELKVNNEATLTTPLVQRLRAVGGERVDLLIQKYIGQRDAKK
jgi:hypothetical protein